MSKRIASKEWAGEALEAFNHLCSTVVPDGDTAGGAERDRLLVQGFIEAAATRLPSQASIDKDKERKRKKPTEFSTHG